MRATALRITKVLVVYLLVASLLWAALPAIRRVFLLPQLFDPLARGMLVAGALLAALVAWRYPAMGVGAEADREGGAE